MSDFLQPYGLEPTSLVCPWDSAGKNIGVGFLALLQGIFLTQGSNPISLMSPALPLPGEPIRRWVGVCVKVC